ncbi:MAG: hypothetical protein OIF32_08545, partial [Campylobacterales bacterium]|nr:hypothetical protein [Campylobacterales bacterium]
LQSKFNSAWLSTEPYTKESMDDKLDSLDMQEVERGQDIAYSGKTLDFERFEKSKEVLREVIKLAGKRKSKVLLLIPPALFGEWRGHNKTLELARTFTKEFKHVSYYNAAKTVLDPSLYYDNHHLNTNGIVFFTKEKLKPVVEEILK